ncbi:MAG: substrate-binding domain-containing protein [Oscillospiraceae bacterium]|nr:substrate-binding domain-containing protein [Oscillospiraceae bacterium]
MKKYLIFVIVVLLILPACKQMKQAQDTLKITTPENTASENEGAKSALLENTAQISEGFTFTAENMPIIDGSTATIPLISAVYSVLLGVPRSEADAMVNVSGTDDAYSQLINGAADILLVYSPSPETLASANGQDVELEMAPIGRDGLVFLVNVMNPVRSLTPDQIVSIYSGKLENWKDVNSKDVEIKAFQRPYRSGSQTMMDELVMKGVPMAETEVEYVIGEMGRLIDAVAAYNNAESAIGYNVYYFVSKMEMNENVRMLSVGGVEPTTESISDGSYPFVSDFYAVIRKDAPYESPERILFNWIQSEDGQNLVRHEGYAAANANEY